MNTYETAIIILMVLNLLLGIDAWWLAKQCNKADRKVKELDEELAKEKANNRFVMPVAEVKAQFSGEDIMKFKEMLKKTKLQFEPDDKKCECDHFYDSIVLDKDVKHCCERMILHCQYCCHEIVIPIREGLLMDLIMNGGKT